MCRGKTPGTVKEYYLIREEEIRQEIVKKKKRFAFKRIPGYNFMFTFRGMWRGGTISPRPNPKQKKTKTRNREASKEKSKVCMRGETPFIFISLEAVRNATRCWIFDLASPKAQLPCWDHLNISFFYIPYCVFHIACNTISSIIHLLAPHTDWLLAEDGRQEIWLCG